MLSQGSGAKLKAEVTAYTPFLLRQSRRVSIAPCGALTPRHTPPETHPEVVTSGLQKGDPSLQMRFYPNCHTENQADKGDNISTSVLSGVWPPFLLLQMKPVGLVLL